MSLQANLKDTTSTETSKKNRNKNRYFSCLAIFLILLALFTIAFSFSAERLWNCISRIKSQKRYWTCNQNVTKQYVFHKVFDMLNKRGYKKSTDNCEWDLLWISEMPSEKCHQEMKILKSHQKVNYIPGSEDVITKANLASMGIERIPPGFTLPQDKDKLLNYSKKNPYALFFLKYKTDQVKLVNIQEVDYNNSDYFIQLFIKNPLLVDGFKIDIGLFTIITSIDPLRMYVYNGDILIRFCTEKYDQFDRTKVKKFVAGNDYLTVENMSSLDQYCNKLGYSNKETFNAYLQTKGIDSKKIYQQAEDTIRKFALSVENSFIDRLKRYPSKKKFFELLRCDFLIDEDINVHLLECHLITNYTARPVFALLHEQVLHNALELLGITNRIDQKFKMQGGNSAEEILVTDRNLVTYPHKCVSSECQSSCKLLECQFCKPCLTEDTKEFLKEALKEHHHRGYWKRIFPPTMIQGTVTDLSNLTKKNQLLYMWFQEKCNMDSTWC